MRKYGFPGIQPPGNVQYHELRITFEFEDQANLAGIGTTALEATLWCDYVYLDQDERKKFAAQPHEYLIEQLQFTGDENVTIASTSKAQQIRLSFNHPCKLLAWVIADPTKHGRFTGGFTGAKQEALAPLQSAKLMLNGHDRADTRVGAVFNKVVPYQANKALPDAGIYFMSFALSPCQHAPSGSLNLSRIDAAVLALQFKAASVAGNTTATDNIANVTAPETTTVTDATSLSALRIFAINYNVLRIKIIVQKSYLQHLSGKGAGNLLRVRGLLKSTPVASAVHCNRARSLVAGTRKATRYQGNWGNPFLAWRNEPGYGHKSLDDGLLRPEIENPHGNILRALWKAYEWPSETERQSLDDEGLSIPSLVKIQSTPRSKDVDIVYERHGGSCVNPSAEKLSAAPIRKGC